jgi:cytochrome c oxidase assembly protein subunit 15
MMSEGKFMHDTVLIEQTPVYKNFVEGKSGVQFVHRILAFIVLASIILIYIKGKKLKLSNYQLKGLNALLILVGLQFLLGVFTILLQVPVWLGVAHQVGAFFLLSAMTFTLHRFSK